MRIKQVCVLGGSGFVGSAIVARLDAAGYQVKVLTRRRERAKHLILLPNVDVVECDVMDDNALAEAMRGSQAVVNLIGILHESRKMTFTMAHAELPRRLAHICHTQGITRLLHMSALQASIDGPSAYLRSKAAGEAVVMDYANQLHVTVFRPSVIFGRGDSFITLFASLVKLLPVVLLAKPEAKFQPVWVEDVAQAFVKSMEDIDTYGQAYDLGGPKVYTLRELVQMVADILGIKRRIIGLNDQLSYLQAYAMELLPIKLMTRDNLYSMQVDNVCQGEFPKVFGIQPTALEVVVPDYLVNRTPRNAYNRYRGYAGR
ncbi:MAG TPA: complex I NDUFA9 subunit family protein [Methylophilaceae bacterium]|jgi:NADH dehydrogenase